jgi:hypothetical protein
MKHFSRITLTLLAVLLLSSVWISHDSNAADKATDKTSESKIPVTISGGHQIGKDDFGRPVVLIAAALDVKPEVFRKAFSGVTPAHGRGPTGDEARKNKDALMKILAPHKVTNDRLDEVSNYYRFRPQNKELWPVKPAEAHAIVENGKIKKIVVTEPGAGYSSEPEIKIKGFDDAKFKVKLALSKDLKKNGGIAAIEVVTEKNEKKTKQKK